MRARVSSQILYRGSGCENGGENYGDNGGEITGSRIRWFKRRFISGRGMNSFRCGEKYTVDSIGTCIAPLERMKLEYIVRGEQRSLLGLIQRIATTEGIRGFWKGNLVNILRTAPFKSINFYAYDTYRGQLLRLSGNEETTNFERFVAGAAAGVTASLLCLPLDTIRTVMVALGGEALGGVVDAFRHMIQTEGIGGWRTKWHVDVNLAMKVLRQCLFLSDVPVNVLGVIASHGLVGSPNNLASSCLLRSFNLREEGTDISPDRFNSCFWRTNLDTARVHAFISSFST
ncbi:hypothetical protein DY000_02009212 [Brassica cretica]|uniref:Uncharacterized protein n=1 Tax=Brassica cretica TaxID=69181 RepID=A0ABQ7CGF1_BRACR|nr:hypothetical protein DY000_02009212 [Brassica cretica]